MKNALFVNEPYKSRWNDKANDIQDSENMELIRQAMADLAQEFDLEVGEVSVITRRILDFEAKASGKAHAAQKTAVAKKSPKDKATTSDDDMDARILRIVKLALQGDSHPTENTADKQRAKAKARHAVAVESE